MTDIKIGVKGNKAALLRPVNLVSGTVGQTCTFYFDEEWKNYSTKTITYKVGSTVLGSYKIESDSTTVPNKVFMMSGLPLEIALTASTTGGAVIPTSWCYIGVIQQGAAFSGDVQDEPSKPEGDDDEIIYDGGGFDNNTDVKDETIYEGGGV